MTSIIAYNLILLAFEGMALVAALRVQRGILLVALSQPFADVILSIVLGQGMFGSLGLLAYGLFIHTPLMLLALAIVLRRKSRALSYLAALLLSVDVAIGIDAFLIEPHALQISTVSLENPKLTRPVRIVLLADVQMKEVGEYERAALKLALEQKPDVILFAGDYLQLANAHDYPRIRKALSDYLAAIHFKAPLGVYAVPGNVDPPEWVEIFAPVGAKAFSRTQTIETGELSIVGLSLRDSFDRSLRVAESERFQIVLGHGPDFALGDIRADLLLAGHTHGGQVVLPGIGPLMTLSAVPKAWASGVTYLSNARTLIVSRGVGMERGLAPPLRFLCRPEIVVIDIVPSEMRNRS